MVQQLNLSCKGDLEGPSRFHLPSHTHPIASVISRVLRRSWESRRDGTERGRSSLDGPAQQGSGLTAVLGFYREAAGCQLLELFSSSSSQGRQEPRCHRVPSTIPATSCGSISPSKLVTVDLEGRKGRVGLEQPDLSVAPP